MVGEIANCKHTSNGDNVIVSGGNSKINAKKKVGSGYTNAIKISRQEYKFTHGKQK
jgi:hypothetical protein